VFVGPSVARLVTRDIEAGPGVYENSLAPGLLVDIQVIVVALPEIGLGLDAFGHLNVVKSVAGVRLVLYLGNDRW
jgi:hypothetical protein